MWFSQLGLGFGVTVFISQKIPQNFASFRRFQKDAAQNFFLRMLARSSPFCHLAERHLSAHPRQHCSDLIAIMRRRKIDGVTKEKQQERHRCCPAFAWMKHLDRGKQRREERKKAWMEEGNNKYSSLSDSCFLVPLIRNLHGASFTANKATS